VAGRGDGARVSAVRLTDRGADGEVTSARLYQDVSPVYAGG
jgi:hypothetical protein